MLIERWLVVSALLVPGCGRSDAPRAAANAAYAALQERGADAMGVDQYTSSHIFESLPDGGRIVLQRDRADVAGTAIIRAHMQDIATRFAGGDFTLPGFVHAQAVPGTDIMAVRRDRITYTAGTLPRGGQVRITTTDSVAVAAVHDFLAFQRMDHRTAEHEHDRMQK